MLYHGQSGEQACVLFDEAARRACDPDAPQERVG